MLAIIAIAILYRMMPYYTIGSSDSKEYYDTVDADGDSRGASFENWWWSKAGKTVKCMFCPLIRTKEEPIQLELYSTVTLQTFLSATKDCDGIWPFINAVDDGGRPKVAFKTCVKFWSMFQPGKVYINFRMAPGGLQGMSKCLMESGPCHEGK